MQRRGFVFSCLSAVAGLFGVRGKPETATEHRWMPPTGRFVYRVGPVTEAQRIPWEHQQTGDRIILVDVNEGIVERVLTYTVAWHHSDGVVQVAANPLESCSECISP